MSKPDHQTTYSRIISDGMINKQNNFDFIRVSAAVLVFMEHAWPIFTGSPVPFDLCRLLFGYSYGATGILIFFSLSGFLVAHSYLTTQHWLKFLIKRFLRIWPALAVNIMFTILVLGMLFSTLSVNNYFIHPETWQYFQNIFIFRTYYTLPGVFESSLHSNSVNGSLWTIPYEFTCYIILSFLFLLNFIRKKWVFTCMSMLVWIVYLIFQDKVDGMTIPLVGITLRSLMLPLIFFLSGVCFYLWRNAIVLNSFTMMICCEVMLGVMVGWFPRELMIIVLPYLVFMFAFSPRIRLQHFGKYGDVSYGFYLYAYPVKKCFAAMAPGWPFAVLFIASFITTFILAFASWHLGEKPCLKLKTTLNL
jgi:peptidoglycan/LPS O-acetylase OafA/YrhL